jgi:hypothetical protein
MKRHVVIAVSLALGVAIGAMGQRAQAQGRIRYAFPYDRVAAADPSYQETPLSPDNWTEGDSPNSFHGDGASISGQGSCGCNGGGSGGCQDGYCDAPCGDACDCYDDCGWWPCDDVMFRGVFGGLCGERCGRICLDAEYLYVRAVASHSLAYADIAPGVQDNVQLDFRHDSSYRFRGGYELGNCGEELRFTFTRFNSYANAAVTDSTVADHDIVAPFVGIIPDGGQLLVDADVNVRAYDLELVKTIPLGGTAVCDGSCGCGGECCGDCGCGGCAPRCPAWDITWSGGIRFADADWSRTFVALDEVGGDIVEQAVSTMNFEGGGVRMGLEGRRYFGCAGIFSVFLRGDLSLLLGNLDTQVVLTDNSAQPPTVETTTTSTRNVIPVTDVEGGMTLQLSCRTRLSAGYLFSAWHDLGFRDDSSICVDGANILAFDGVFARLEACF